MISHQHKCIFVHIPRTAGSSIEKWITGSDQWLLNPCEKHLTAAQAKEYYSDYWQEYWKFSIVRRPVDRFMSMLKYGDHFGVCINSKNELDISSYVFKFGGEITVEYDHRFIDKGKLIEMCFSQGHALEPGSLYGNLLGREMNNVFCFEDLEGTSNNQYKWEILRT